MAKRLKKAFTITELVIVIAVVAILAAVLIPTFSNIIKKANESADTQTIVNMNHILNAEQILDGKPDTMEEAVLVIEQGGYKVENLTPTTDGYDIVWDEENNRLALLDKDGKTVYCETELTAQKEKIWKITEQVPANDGYSYYLAPGFTGTSVTAYAGLDVGKNTQIASVAVEIPTAAVDVKVRTKGGDLTVNAPNATVRHYDDVNGVDVQAVADASYHEYGNVAGEFTVANGHVTLESGSKTNEIYVTGNAVKIDWKSDAKPVSVGISAGVDQSTVTVQTDSEVPVVSDVDEAEKSLFAGGFGTEASPYLIATAEQFKNIYSLYSDKTAEGDVYQGEMYAFKQVTDIVLPALDYEISFFTGVYDGGGYNLSYDETVSCETFSAFFGVVFNQTTIKNLNIQLRSNQPFSLIYSTDWYADASDLTVENVTVDSSDEIVLANTGNFGFFGCFTMNNFNSIRFVDCVNNANLINQGASTGAFVGSGFIFMNSQPNAKVEFVNCVNNGDISGSTYAGVLYGNPAYTGLYDAETGDKVATDYVAGQISVEGMKNNGVVMSLATSGGVASLAPGSRYLNDIYQNACGGSYIASSYFSGQDVYVSQTGNVYSTNLNGAQDGITFKLGFNINLLDNGDGTFSNTTKFFYDLQSDADVTATNVLTHKAYDLQKAKDVFGDAVVNALSFDENGIAKYVSGDVMYFIFQNKQIGRNPETSNPGETGIVIYLYAFNANGGCVGVVRI